MNQEMVIDLSYTVAELIENINIRIDNICSLFNNQINDEGSTRLIYLIDDFMVLVEGISALQLEVYEIETLNENLINLSIQLENQDFNFISEILRYEIKPIIEYLGECIKNVH